MLVVDADTVMEGQLTILGNVRIDGLFRGAVTCTSLEIGSDGVVEGNVIAERLIIAGQLIGIARARVVHLYGTAIVEGEVFQEKLSMDADASLLGESRRLKAFEMPHVYRSLEARERQLDEEIEQISTAARVRKADQAEEARAAFDQLRARFPALRFQPGR